MVEWARRKGRFFHAEEWIDFFARGGIEHEIRFDHPNRQVIKITRIGEFGRRPVLRRGELSMGAAGPLSYLDRLHLSNDLFADSWNVLGVTEDRGLPRIITTQPLIVGERPTAEEVDSYMDALGFDRVGKENIFRSRSDQIIVVDCHLGNFLRSETGQIFAIDVIPAECSEDLWQEIRRMAD